MQRNICAMHTQLLALAEGDQTFLMGIYTHKIVVARQP